MASDKTCLEIIKWDFNLTFQNGSRLLDSRSRGVNASLNNLRNLFDSRREVAHLIPPNIDLSNRR